MDLEAADLAVAHVEADLAVAHAEEDLAADREAVLPQWDAVPVFTVDSVGGDVRVFMAEVALAD